MPNADCLTKGTETGLEHKRCFPQCPDETTERSPAPGAPGSRAVTCFPFCALRTIENVLESNMVTIPR